MTIERLEPGRMPSARDWNEVGRVVDEHDAERGRLSFPSTRGEFGDGTLVRVENNTSSDREAFEVLGVDAPVFTPAQNQDGFRSTSVISLSCTTPTSSHTSFVILQEAIPAHGIGWGLISGTSRAWLNVTASGDTTAGLEVGVASRLKTGKGGAKIIWKESGTGTGKWGIVQIGTAEEILLGKTDAAHAKGASGVVSIWTGTPGSETDSGRNETAYNRFANVAITKWVMLAHNGHGFYLISAEC